ncbi:MAG TPA: hypothetical protein VFB66_30260 [Tepidisphaeraceae bacterium]|jgi:hypothetical protein|nr:hypothetical protein [Tepidisphaeraceae bacterium]
MSLFTRAATGIVSSLGLCLMVTGCAADRHEDIPKSAPMVAKGQTDVTWAAPSEGDVYVYDQSEGKMLYSGRVERGDNLVVDARKDRIRLDGRTVMDKQIRDNNEIEVFFRENPLAVQARETRPAEQRIVVEQQPDRSSDSSRIVVEPQEKSEGNRVIVEPAKEGDSTIRIER